MRISGDFVKGQILRSPPQSAESEPWREELGELYFWKHVGDTQAAGWAIRGPALGPTCLVQFSRLPACPQHLMWYLLSTGMMGT